MGKKSTLITLLVGDLIALLLVTLVGISSHNEQLSFYRTAVNFLPLVIAWLIVSPWFGAYDANMISSPKRILQILLAVFVCTPFAAVLRGMILNTAVQTSFVLVFALTNTVGIGLWRSIWVFLHQRKN